MTPIAHSNRVPCLELEEGSIVHVPIGAHNMESFYSIGSTRISTRDIVPGDMIAVHPDIENLTSEPREAWIGKVVTAPDENGQFRIHW